MPQSEVPTVPPLNAMEDFRREVSYHILRRNDDTILLTATMTDCFHDILLEVAVDAGTLVIKDATVDFRTSPARDCHQAGLSLKQLKGLVIGPGIFRNIRVLLAGIKGCSNVRSLLAGLLPLAINVKAAAGISDQQEVLDTIHNRLVGTCAGYATPLIRSEPVAATPCNNHPKRAD